MTRTVRILDAGCGRTGKWEFDAALAGVSLEDSRVTGLDIDGAALSENPLVDHRIVGSVETYPLPPEAFDVVVCWDVLEHLREPYQAMENLARTLKPGGRMILGFPNVLSFKGLVTKLTPHSFHRWAYKRVFRTDLEPYPTVLRLSLRPVAVRRWARRKGFEVQFRFENGRVPAFCRLLVAGSGAGASRCSGGAASAASKCRSLLAGRAQRRRGLVRHATPKPALASNVGNA